jgi:hypothetical protein
MRDPFHDAWVKQPLPGPVVVVVPAYGVKNPGSVAAVIDPAQRPEPLRFISAFTVHLGWSDENEDGLHDTPVNRVTLQRFFINRDSELEYYTQEVPLLGFIQRGNSGLVIDGI